MVDTEVRELYQWAQLLQTEFKYREAANIYAECLKENPNFHTAAYQ